MEDKVEGAPLLSILTSNGDDETIDVELKDKLILEFESNIPYITNIQNIQELPFYDDIKQHEQQNQTHRMRRVIYSWLFSVFYWISIVAFIYFVKMEINHEGKDSSAWWASAAFGVISIIFCCCSPFTSSHPEIRYDSPELYTKYSWQRKMSAIQKRNGLPFLWASSRIAGLYYCFEWKAPDGEKYVSKAQLRNLNCSNNQNFIKVIYYI